MEMKTNYRKNGGMSVWRADIELKHALNPAYPEYHPVAEEPDRIESSINANRWTASSVKSFSPEGYEELMHRADLIEKKAAFRNMNFPYT